MPKATSLALTLSILPLAATLTTNALAAPLRDLLLPIDCKPGKNCWIVRYVDHDPGPGSIDYACGVMTGDGHKGTDFAVRDLSLIATGVTVRAASAGRVAAIRDGMEDRLIDAADTSTVGGRECGNGIRIDHGDGWVSLYCHMRRGSHLVAEGDQVAAGQPLGLVGASGHTSFPHLHFDVRHHDQIVDPFVGKTGVGECGSGKASLWRDDVRAAMEYRQPLLTNSGISTVAPEKADARKGWHRAQALPAQSPLLTLWVDGYWFDQGDQVQFVLHGPDQKPVVERRFEVGEDHQRWFSFASAPRPPGGWPRGTYRGEVRVQRAGDPLPQTITSSVEID